MLFRSASTGPEPSSELAAPVSPPTPTATAAPDWRTAPLVLPGGLTLISASWATRPARGYVLDRAQGRYVEIGGDHDRVWPSPRGDVVAVRDDDRPDEVGLLEPRSGTVRWVRTGPVILSPQWSPDGTRLLVTLLSKESGALSFGVLTSAGSFRRLPVREGTGCTDRCRFTWLPNGEEVALPHSSELVVRRESEPHQRRGLVVFSVHDGTRTRFVPARGDVAGPAAWSPRGHFVVVDAAGSPQLVMVESGEVITTELPSADVTWVGDNLVYLDLAGDPPQAVLVNPRGVEITRQSLPAQLSQADEVVLGPLSGHANPVRPPTPEWLPGSGAPGAPAQSGAGSLPVDEATPPR